LVHNQLESLLFLKKLSVKIFYRPETAVLQSVHCISICSSLIKTAQKYHIMTTQKRARLNKIISTWLSWLKQYVKQMHSKIRVHRTANKRVRTVHIGGSQTWFLKNPKSSNFGKIFPPYFWALKIDPEKRNFDIFRPRNFLKIAKTNSKLYFGQTIRKNQNFEKLIFSSESA